MSHQPEMFRTIASRALMAAAVLVGILFASTLAHGQEKLRVAAAADLQFAMKDLAARYEYQSKQSVEVVYGSSGNFTTQIENGAPFDLFFSADSSYPNQLVEHNLADKQSLYRYAIGRLALWASRDEHLDLTGKGFQALLDPRVTKIAIANPEHAPYGRAALAALQKVGIYDQVKPKLVYGENISQAAQFVQSGSAQVGLVALSLAISPAMQSGDRWLVPTEFHPSLEQVAVVISSSKNKDAALKFLVFVKSAEGREVLAKYGFSDPANPVAEKKP
jgi:molybdate transport system substrate-binding protein